MGQVKASLLYDWLDPIKDADVIQSTLRQLERVKTPRDIAYGVVSKLQGKGRINTKVITSKEFIQTLIIMAPNLGRGENVAAVRKQINLMKEVMDWDHIENQLKEAKENDRNGEDIILLIRNAQPGCYEKIKNALAEKDITYCEVFTSHFDGEKDSEIPEIKITGSASEIADILAEIEESLHEEIGKVIKYVSPQNKFERDNLTVGQALAIARAESMA